MVRFRSLSSSYTYPARRICSATSRLEHRSRPRQIMFKMLRHLIFKMTRRLETVDDRIHAVRDALAHILMREDVETAAQHMGERDLGDLVRSEGRIAHGALLVLVARRERPARASQFGRPVTLRLGNSGLNERRAQDRHAD